MKSVFVETENVKIFIAVADALKAVTAGVPGMGLVYGRRGLGKTRTALWYTAGNGDIYLRAKRKWTPFWLMEELAIELMLTPGRTFRDLFREVVAALTSQPRLVVIDETDLAGIDVLETVRDLHDLSGAPFILQGMEKAKTRLSHFSALYDRFLHIEEFKPLTETDIRTAAREMFELVIDTDVIAEIRSRTDGNFRKSIIMLKNMEGRARINGSHAIRMEDIEAWKKN